MTIRTKFDGQTILLPKELVGHSPCDLEIVLADDSGRDSQRPSIWDVVAQSRGNLNPSDILRQTSADRDQWGQP